MAVRIDIERAFKQLPVRKEDWPLLGFRFQGFYFVQIQLPFSLSASCLIFEEVGPIPTSLHPGNIEFDSHPSDSDSDEDPQAESQADYVVRSRPVRACRKKPRRVVVESDSDV